MKYYQKDTSYNEICLEMTVSNLRRMKDGLRNMTERGGIVPPIILIANENVERRSFLEFLMKEYVFVWMKDVLY